jgi:hypothetical protein
MLLEAQCAFMIAQSQTFLPWWFGWLIIAVATIFLVAITMAVFYNQFGEVAGKRQTLQSAPFAVLLVLLMAVLLTVVDFDIFNPNPFALWLLLLSIVLYAWGFITSRRRSQQAGAVLLDIGWREHRKGQVALHTIVLVLMLVGAGLGIATKGWQSVGLPVLLIVQ